MHGLADIVQIEILCVIFLSLVRKKSFYNLSEKVS